MYNEETIDRLVEEYKRTSKDAVFEKLLSELVNIIDMQLVKKYEGAEIFWDDLRQEVLLKIWKNREGIKNTKTVIPFQHYYGQIRYWLRNGVKRIKPALKDLDTIYFDDLGIEDKRRFGIELTEEDWEYFGN